MGGGTVERPSAKDCWKTVGIGGARYRLTVCSSKVVKGWWNWRADDWDAARKFP